MSAIDSRDFLDRLAYRSHVGWRGSSSKGLFGKDGRDDVGWEFVDFLEERWPSVGGGQLVSVVSTNKVKE